MCDIESNMIVGDCNTYIALPSGIVHHYRWTFFISRLVEIICPKNRLQDAGLRLSLSHLDGCSNHVPELGNHCSLSLFLSGVWIVENLDHTLKRERSKIPIAVSPSLLVDHCSG